MPDSTRPFIFDETKRLETLRSYGILDTNPEKEFDAIVNLIASHLEVPMAMISLIDDSRQWFKTKVGLDADSTPRDIAFCDYAIRSPDIMVVPDASKDSRFIDNPFVTGEANVRFYAGAPLIGSSGQAIGTLCVTDTKPRALSEKDFLILKALAEQVILQLELRKSNTAMGITLQVLQHEKELQEVRRLEVQKSHALLQNLTFMAPGVLYQYQLNTDGSSEFPYASAGIEDIYEVSPSDVLHDASLIFQRIHPQDYKLVKESIQHSADTLTLWDLEYRVDLPRQGVRWRHGTARPEKLANGNVLWYGFITDSTERRLAVEAVERLAFYDPLTKLPNRRFVMDKITNALANHAHHNSTCALMFLDLDHFKEINDVCGHAHGDELLNIMATRFSAIVRGTDVVARFGGDEFVIFIENLGNLHHATQRSMDIAEKIRTACMLPFHFAGDSAEYTISASIGVTLFSDTSITVGSLLSQADTALYKAKQAGRNKISLFKQSMHEEVEQRLVMANDLREAVLSNSLSVYIQSQVDRNGVVVGGELLLRWHHPEKGMIPPNDFIPIAEDSDIILHLGQWVLLQACLTLVTLKNMGLDITLSVNVSPKQFQQSNFVQIVLDTLSNTGANPAQLILEVTEGLLMQKESEIAYKIDMLVEHGLKISIDDFGTGYSSLAYLKNWNIYELKIDRAFVHDLPHDPSSKAIVDAIINMAGPLSLRLVAEGVETQEQADHLIARNCDLLQGYLYSRPIPTLQWLEELKATHA